ncbi:MAG: efflux RND transporter periplasmic adaptor subunit [Candidatus Krumholzibacteria bacterium]|nr:efflux RND transporter periplasmic adaptor subunit [Candidatus Krumholzibacteria bacterium]
MSRQSGSRRRLAAIASIAVVAVLFALRFWTLQRGESAASIRDIQEREGIPVEVAAAKTGDIEVWTGLAGTVEGIVQYPIVSTNTIRVADVLRREGDRVAPGDVVVRLAKTAPNPMLHSYSRSKALYEDALRDERRMRTLYDEGAVSKQQLDKAEMALDIAETDLLNAREGINLVADRAGIVTSLLVEEGETAMNGSPVAWVARTDTVRISFEAGSRQAMALRVGQSAEWFSTETGERGEGRITRLDLSADPQTHLLAGEATFPNPGGRLIPGVLVSMRVLTGDRRGVVTVPAGCLLQRNGNLAVFVVEESGGALTARQRVVAVGLRGSDEVEILEGVAAGERVVVFGQTMIEDGTLVRIVARGEGER